MAPASSAGGTTATRRAVTSTSSSEPNCPAQVQAVFSRWRSMVDKSDLLRPVDIATRIGDVLFTVGQVCTIAGITKMQLDLWTERAQIATLGAKQRLYDTESVEHVMLIAQARELGFSVDAAIEAAAAFRARSGGGQSGRLAA